MPFPICSRHAVRLYMRMRATVQRAHEDGTTQLVALFQNFDERRAREASRIEAQHEPRVYYIRMGEHIKIGTTTQLRKRIASYPPMAELLAVEPGGVETEQRRHAEFSHLLDHRKEWFRAEPDLLAFIARLLEVQQRQKQRREAKSGR